MIPKLFFNFCSSRGADVPSAVLTAVLGCQDSEPLGEILTKDVYDAVLRGECIREYGEDKPLPSCLVFGWTGNQRPIHAVCGHDEERDRAVVITVYEPHPSLWRNFRERIER